MDTATITVSKALNAGEWNGFVERHPLGTIDHLWEWQTVFEDVFGHGCEYLVARQEGRVIGVLPLVIFKSLLFGRQLVSLPMLNYGGLLLDHESAVEPLLSRAKEVAVAAGARHVELRHPARLTTLPSRQHKVSMRMALPESSDELWQRLDGRVRNHVRKAQKSGLTTAVGGSELVAQFYAVFAQNMRDLGTPVYPQRLFRRVLEQFPARARICVVSLEARPVAGALTLRWNETVLVPWASSLRAHRHLSPNTLLYWTMIERAIMERARVFDFGRSSPHGGTYTFKQQWGATPEAQCWEYILLRGSKPPDQGPSQGRFNLAIEGWKRLPLWLANCAGPYVVRNIP